MVHLSPKFDPPILKGLRVYPDNPFRFDFILDQGNSALPARGEGDSPLGNNEKGTVPFSESAPGKSPDALKQESNKLIKYFLASLTIPEKDLWVNLSPYEKDRIIPDAFGKTEMGRDLLAEDYILKQITSSLIYPEGETGKKFWKKVYAEAADRFKTTDIPVSTFNKVWIVPEKAVVYENAKIGAAYVEDSRLKVMLEEDYLSTQKHQLTPSADLLGKQVLKDIVLPELTKEVNTGANFAQLREVYNSLILASWYKKKIKDSILQAVYEDKNKITGVDSKSTINPRLIYQRYLQAFKRGVYNYIKEERDPVTQEMIPRKYFSGGWSCTHLDSAMTIKPFQGSWGVIARLARKTGVFVIRASVENVKTESPSALRRRAMIGGLSALLLPQMLAACAHPEWPAVNTEGPRQWEGKNLYAIGQKHRSQFIFGDMFKFFNEFTAPVDQQSLQERQAKLKEFMAQNEDILDSYRMDLLLIRQWIQQVRSGTIVTEDSPKDYEKGMKDIKEIYPKIIQVLDALHFDQDQAKNLLLIMYGPAYYSDFFGYLGNQIKIVPIENNDSKGEALRLLPELVKNLFEFVPNLEYESRVRRLGYEEAKNEIKEMVGIMKTFVVGMARESDIRRLKHMMTDQELKYFEPFELTARVFAHNINDRNKDIMGNIRDLTDANILIAIGAFHVYGLQEMAMGRWRVLKNDAINFFVIQDQMLDQMLSTIMEPYRNLERDRAQLSAKQGVLSKTTDRVAMDFTKHILVQRNTNQKQRESRAIVYDQTMAEKGGIDLTTGMSSLEINNKGQGIKFRIDPSLYQQLKNAPGFIPVIIDITPLKDLTGFLGLSRQVNK